MTMTTVAIASREEADSFIATILLAFAADPMARWSLGDAQQYLTHMPELVRAFAGQAFSDGHAHHLGTVAAALWLPPDAVPDEEALVSIMQRAVPEERQGEAFGVLEQMERFRPTEPHWYLPLLGVDPVHQGKGYGSTLLAAGLQRCDRDRTLAYLESSNPRNIPLYERHGFKAIGRIQSGDSPTMVPMVRQARSR